MNQIASHFRRLGDAQPPEHAVPLGQMLLDDGQLGIGDLLPALNEHKALGVPLGQVVVSRGALSEQALFDQLALQWNIRRCNVEQIDHELALKIGLPFCLRYKAIPVELKDGVLFLAVSGKEEFAKAEQELEEVYGLVMPLIASPKEIERALSSAFHEQLAAMAATDLPIENSCRGLAENALTRGIWSAIAITLIVTLLLTVPGQFLVGLTVISIAISISSALLKTAALIANVTSKPVENNKLPALQDLPKVSVMVPLHREPGIADMLVKRLGRLTYPKPLLEILLVVEENDTLTIDAIRAATLPSWITAVVVPEGNPKTKPRALNHAYKFCSGDIIGIYDAEDAPDPDQIEKVVAKFAASGSDVACLQGILQFYNPRQNWLARCFTMDYAAWFRVVLPGLSRLGMPVPLGGTTLFLKRDAIENMMGWDAHNVTEDADLGIRLNRAGYRTELFDSVTGEEANCYPWKWIRQRSRWIKGYMVTYWAHMRNPLKLRRDLGTKAFIGFQILFLGTCLHFLTAPVLWSFWLSYLGVIHAFFAYTPTPLTAATAWAFLAVELVGMIIFAISCVRSNRRFLIPWIPTMSFYFLLAVPAGLKALWEFFRAPVFWDKTDHGHSVEEG